MPTITHRAFGVPGCLDPLNYKSRMIGYLVNDAKGGFWKITLNLFLAKM
jgi:hypothetical protein